MCKRNICKINVCKRNLLNILLNLVIYVHIELVIHRARATAVQSEYCSLPGTGCVAMSIRNIESSSYEIHVELRRNETCTEELKNGVTWIF